MAIGFVLLTTLPGMEASVREALSDVDLVTDHWMLFGEYDLIARVQADEEYALTRCIVEEIRQLPGIKPLDFNSGLMDCSSSIARTNGGTFEEGRARGLGYEERFFVENRRDSCCSVPHTSVFSRRPRNERG